MKNKYEVVFKINQIYTKLYQIINSCKTYTQLNNAYSFSMDILDYNNLQNRFNFSISDNDYDFIYNEIRYYKDKLLNLNHIKSTEIFEKKYTESKKNINNIINTFIYDISKYSKQCRINLLNEMLFNKNKEESYIDIINALNECSNITLINFITTIVKD